MCSHSPFLLLDLLCDWTVDLTFAVLVKCFKGAGSHQTRVKESRQILCVRQLSCASLIL